MENIFLEQRLGDYSVNCVVFCPGWCKESTGADYDRRKERCFMRINSFPIVCS
jgi:hypothetical protein